MGDRLAEIRDVATRDYEEVRALIDRLGEDTLERKTSNGWTVRRLAGHVAGSPRGHIFVIGRLRKGGSATIPTPLSFLIDLRNWWEGRKYTNASKPQLLQSAESCYNDYIAAINSLSEEELDRGGDVLRLGKMTMYEYLIKSGDHGREHAADIRRTIGI
jgi:hypothetical protein